MALPVLSVVEDAGSSLLEQGQFGAAVWRADALVRGAEAGRVVASGHALLDAQLPGGGWPVGGLCEILQPHSPQHEWRLLLPALSAVQQAGVGQQGQAAAAGWVVLIGAPQVPFGPALAARGLDLQRLVWVTASTMAERLWAGEQALRCAEVAAVVLWLSQVQAAALRRLQVAAQTHAKLLFVLRPAQARSESSPALLRLLLSAGGCGAGTQGKDWPVVPDPDAVQVQLLKRRGPPLAQTLVLAALVPGLSALLALAPGPHPCTG